MQVTLIITVAHLYSPLAKRHYSDFDKIAGRRRMTVRLPLSDTDLNFQLEKYNN